MHGPLLTVRVTLRGSKVLERAAPNVFAHILALDGRADHKTCCVKLVG
jgi:hypothetical protein